MLDEATTTRPRIALVFGNADSAGHLREALADHLEIVYATSADAFDAARLTSSRASAALVNLDDCDWLDDIEARLNEAGIAVVFNDPEISSGLEGWAQARWLRHLMAKLIGSTDFDPPRPLGEAPPAPAAPGPAGARETPVARADDSAVAERPLSRSEIESMTADFTVVQAAAPVAGNHVGGSGAQTPEAETAMAETGLDEAPEVAMATEPETETPAFDAEGTQPAAVASPGAGQPDAGADADVDAAGALDVDTEALSAMIDARLAEPATQPNPESSQVWRVAEGGEVTAVDLPFPDPAPDPVASDNAESAAVPPPAPVMDDDDVFHGFPALDDWELVDPGTPVAAVQAAARSGREVAASVSAIDFAGLELVPMEATVRVESHAEPAEQWMHADEHAPVGADTHAKPASKGANGGHAA